MDRFHITLPCFDRIRQLDEERRAIKREKKVIKQSGNKEALEFFEYQQFMRYKKQREEIETYIYLAKVLTKQCYYMPGIPVRLFGEFRPQPELPKDIREGAIKVYRELYIRNYILHKEVTIVSTAKEELAKKADNALIAIEHVIDNPPPRDSYIPPTHYRQFAQNYFQKTVDI